jgi:hypothetical protein
MKRFVKMSFCTFTFHVGKVFGVVTTIFPDGIDLDFYRMFFSD